MVKRTVLVACLLLCGVSSTYATVIKADAVFVANGASVAFQDQFDNGVFDVPPWIVLTGSPGPESGTLLELHSGDLIAAPVAIDPALGVSAGSILDLTQFPAGSGATLMLFGVQPGDLLSLAVLPDAAVVGDEGGVLGSIALTPGSTASMFLTFAPDGTVTGLVNDVPVFSGPSAFSPSGTVALAVVPEPATVVLLAVAGCVGLLRRRP